MPLARGVACSSHSAVSPPVALALSCLGGGARPSCRADGGGVEGALRFGGGPGLPGGAPRRWSFPSPL